MSDPEPVPGPVPDPVLQPVPAPVPAEAPSTDSDEEAAASPVGRVATRKPDQRGLGLAIFAALGFLLIVGDAAMSARRAGLARAKTRHQLEDLRDFLGATIGEGFEPPTTAPEGVGLEEVVAAIGSWGLAPVTWRNDRIEVVNGDLSFVLEVHDARGRPFRFRRPGVKFPKGWEVLSTDDTVGADLAAAQVVGEDLASVGSRR